MLSFAFEMWSRVLH